MTNLQISDLAERNLALDPTNSFIVQAPAGSGKTSLLVQRYLKLLATVKNPEEILAITFTRKAAFEMRTRIIETLKKANNKTKPKDQYETNSIKLAKLALEQDKRKKWNIVQNPNRLHIQTIDAFCHRLVNQTPVLSKINSNFQIIQNQDAQIYYKKAAQNIFKNLNDLKYSKHLTCLLLHLDNNWERIENLFITMLKSREQWLPHIVGVKNIKNLRQIMEEALKTIAEENIERCVSLFPKKLHQELTELLSFSQNNTEEIFTKKCILSWQGVANLFLTKEYKWRKKVTKNLGFPSASKEHSKTEQELLRLMKARMEELLLKFSSNENLRQSLENLLLSPPIHYDDQQWEMIDALLELLPLLAAELKLIFNQNLVTDHAEISMAALCALGDQETPSELALNLDYRLHHILVDEFQDTSVSQYRLIEKLITAWQPNDGHTIFIVGDPMQSIYRFRQAEVGLFLRAQHEGIGNLKLHPLTLTTNFRSSQNIINWINENFAKVFPVLNDINFGAVPFRPSVAIKSEKQQAPEINLLKNGSDYEEALHITATIKKIQQHHPNDSIAILVRAKKHLQELTPKLYQEKINYQAFELETLQDSLIVQDLFSLTRALHDPTDRIAWLAILRAPWCGLKLADLLKLAVDNKQLIWESIRAYSKLNLSEDGTARLKRFIDTFEACFEQAGRIPWHELVEKTWINLGGPATLSNEKELEYAQTYLELLKSETLTIETLQKKLATLYTPPASFNKVQIMTIHKAKGLEFDHVIIPGINKTSRVDERKLMLWFERPKLHQGSDLLLAPIEASGNDKDPVYKYLHLVEQKKTFYETGRLLYVAMTRAKKSVHITGTIKTDKNDESHMIQIKNNSLLEQLKPCFNKSWLKTLHNNSEEKKLTEASEIKISRLTQNWENPIKQKIQTNSHEPSWQLADNQAAILGTIIHHCLRQISETDLNIWDKKYIAKQQPYWQRLLQQMGYTNIQQGLDSINKAISLTLSDERGRWVLTNHKKAVSEFPITVNINNQFSNYIIDRTFIDEDGIRWIIDYKTGQPAQENHNEFLQLEQEKYSTQLANYAKAMQLLESDQTRSDMSSSGEDPRTRLTPIKLGLYYPLFGGWIEW